MSWRAESTFKAASALADEEKDFLKLVKKVRDILKLQEKVSNGENLQASQLAKIDDLEPFLKDLAAIGQRLPASTEVLDKNQDIVSMLPGKAVENIMKKQRQAQDRLQQDNERRERKEEKVREERQKPEFMCRHDRPILGIAVTRDGYIYTCSKDKFVLCWSMKDTLLKCVCTFAGHRGAVRCVDASDSHPLISGDSDGKIMLWDKDAAKKAPGGKGYGKNTDSAELVLGPVSTIEDGGNVRVLRWCPFDKATNKDDPVRFASACEKLASKPAAIAVWSLRGRKAELLLRLEDLPGKANDLRWAGGAKTKLLSAHDNGYIGVWLAEGHGSLLKTIKLHSAPISKLCLVASGKAVISVSHDSSVKVVDISSQATETLITYKADRPLNAVGATPDYEPGAGGHLVVAGGRDPMVVTTSCLMEDEFEAKVLEGENGMPIAAAKGHFGPVHDLVFMPWLGKTGGFATCSEDGCLRVHALDGSTLHSDRLE